ncbi:MAG: DUF1175 family protein [Vicinamibacteraceae bacterium]|nr:DUF1175 family protein [Vicinamibacteraceae bacterium]
MRPRRAPWPAPALAVRARTAPALAALALAVATSSGAAQVRLTDEADRQAFREWFVLLADAQFYRTTPDVDDCAALVRHAVREALRPHTPEWRARLAVPAVAVAPDVAARPAARDGMLPLFRVSAEPELYAEFADAATLVRLNTRALGRDLGALRPGDLLYFRQPGQRLPDHLMVFVGRSRFEADGDDWVVYHTGPSGPATGMGAGRVPPEGEVRKVRLADLLRHPSPQWRPRRDNPSFAGIFRWRWLL